MAKPAKNQELAQYFTNAYLTEENNVYAKDLGYLIGQFEYQSERRDLNNIERGLLKSLQDFQQYCKLAADEINSGIKKSPNLKAASDEAKRIVEGFATLKRNAPDRYDLYSERYEHIRDNSQVKTAAQWIEDIAKDYKKGTISAEGAALNILAIRHLADAQRGKRANIDKKILTPDEIQAGCSKLYRDPDFKRLLENNKDQLGRMVGSIGISDHGGKMEDHLKKIAARTEGSLRWADDTMGRYKPTKEQYDAQFPSALEWVKHYQKKAADVDIEKTGKGLARAATHIIAARLLSEAEAGSDKKLKKRHMSKDELGFTALNLEHSRVINEFLSNLQEEADKKAQEARAQQLAEINDLPVDHPAIVKEAAKKKGEIDMSLFKDGNGRKLEEKFVEYLKTRPDYEKLDPNVFGHYVPKNLVNEFEIIEKEEIPSEAHKDALGRPVYGGYGDFFERNRTNEDGTASKLYHAAKMAAADDLRRNHPDNHFDRKSLEDKAKKYLKDPVFQHVMKDEALRDKVCRGDMEALAMATDKLKASLPEDIEVQSPDVDVINKLDGVSEMLKHNDEVDVDKLDPGVKEKIRDLTDKLWGLGKYHSEDPDNIYDEENDPEDIRGQIEKLSGKHSVRTINEAREKYRTEGGPEYKSLVNSVKELAYGSPSENDYLKAVNSIIDYQNVHMDEKTGPNVQRVNAAAEALVQITRNSGLAVLAEKQIDRINGARGLKPGDPGYLKAADMNPGREPEIDEPHQEAGRNLEERMKGYSFLNRGNDGSMDADEKDMNDSMDGGEEQNDLDDSMNRESKVIKNGPASGMLI